MSILSDFRSGAKAVLDTVPGIVQTSSSRPASISALPAAWIDEIRLNLLHDSGLRIWNGAEADLYLVVGGFDNEEAQEEADALLALTIDALTDAPHLAGANTVCEPVRVRSSSVDNGSGTSFPAWIITIGNFYASEGR